MKKNFMRMIAAAAAVMTVSANAFVCSAEDVSIEDADLAVYDNNAYADNKELQDIFALYRNFKGGENEDGMPLLGMSSNEDIDGADPNTWSPYPIEDEVNAPEAPVGGDPSTWSPYPIEDEVNAPEAPVGGDPSTWSPFPLEDEETTDPYADDEELQKIFDMYKNFDGEGDLALAPAPDADEPLEISPAPMPDMPNLNSVRTAALIARKAAEGSLSELSESYDANHDGSVNVRDSAYIANQLATK